MSNYLPTILGAGPKLLKAQLNTLSDRQLAEVLKQKYDTDRREWFDEEYEKWFGFEATEQGLLTWEGQGNKLQYRISWESVAERRKELALHSFIIKQELPSPPKQLLEIQSINPEYEEQSSENISVDDVKLPYYDRRNEDKSLPIFSSTKDLHEILLTTPHLKASVDEIRVYLECKPNKKDLVNYIKNIFNNDYTELILSDGRRVGYKTYQNVLHLWEGAYLSRTAQGFYDWGVIAANYEGMRLLGKLHNPSSDAFSSTNQLSFIDAAEPDEKLESPLWEEIIETVLCHGSEIENGKFRIYNQFQKGLPTSEIINSLKHEYGCGGCCPIIAGTDISEQHDTNGITLSKELGSNESITLKWPTVAQRIKELIQQNKYLTAEEKEAFPTWLHQKESKVMDSPSIVSETTDTPDISSFESLSEKAKTTNPLALVYSPWGEIDHSQLIQPGIFQVSTPSHGGIMIASEKVSSVLSDAAQNIGFAWGGYQCYEEDCAATVAIQELIDRNLFPIPVNEYYKEGEYKTLIERNAQQFYPEYWESRTQRLSAENSDNSQLLKKAIELINDFCISEYHEPADIDYSDLSYIEIGCLVTESTEHEIQSVANLKDYRIDTYVDHELIRKEKYTDLQDMIDNALSNLNFDDLVYLSDKEWELFEEAVSETDSPLIQTSSNLTTASDAAFAAQNLIPNETTFELDGRTFMVDRINYGTGMVNFQDITFVQNTGFPIFRTEPISTVRRYLEAQPSEQENKVISKSKVASENFHITDAHLGEGSPKAKFIDNLRAIQLLKQLELENRQAELDEQETLSRYVGWGGLPDAFDPSKENWHKEYEDLKETLTPAEYEAARASTLNAHYTSPTVINAIYKAVSNMGFESGNILEPSCGVGNFFGMLPHQMQDSRLYGVELDSISGRIAKKLYPNANITVAGFETFSHPNFFDLAIGNVPFGQYQVNDKAYNKLGFTIHNYFFAKALDQVRPGGIVAFITSRYTMDSKDCTVRQFLAQRADLLGAIRLPNNAFKANAGAEVVSDIIFLQKRDHSIESESDWTQTDSNENGYSLNRYFINHPEMVLGNSTQQSTAHGMDYTVTPIDGLELSDQLDAAIANIHGTYEAVDISNNSDTEKTIPADPAVKNYSYTTVNDSIYYRENSIMRLCEYEKTSTGEISMQEKRLRGMLSLRNCVRTLIDIQVDGCSDEMLAEQQQKLEKVYSSFTASFGLVNSDANRRVFTDDVDYSLIATLEEVEGRGANMHLKQKSALFSQRTIRHSEPIEHCDTAVEALNVSLGEKGKVDIEYMSQLTGQTEQQLIETLSNVIWLDPESRSWLPGNVYLSGDIRQKIIAAEKAAESEPDLFSKNITALQNAMPERLEAADISVRLGATWIDPAYIEQFAHETFSTTPWMRDKIKVNYSPYTGNWFISGKSYVSSRDIKTTVTFGTSRMNAFEILEQSLNLRPARVVDYIEDEYGNKKAVPNVSETTIAQQRQDLIERTFKDWIFSDSERRKILVDLYNERFNTVRPCQYDGSYLSFTGMNPLIELKPHQKNAVAHVLQGKNTLLFHCVGAGKTYEMIASGVEAKRLGLISKPMFVVPNHLTGDFGTEFRKLYPQANILVTRKEDFEKQNRRRFLAKIAMGNWDGVIIGHSQFSMLPISEELQIKFVEKQLDDLEESLTVLRHERNEDRFSIKQIERSKKMLKARLEKLISGQHKDDMLRFEQLGIDKLFVDEADEFKNLAFASKMDGIGSVDSQKAMDLYLKCQYLDQKTGGKGIVFATGTPIANSIAEMFTMQRYLQSDLLQEKGLSMFDSWGSTFAESVTEMELKPEGTGYRMKTRLAKFYNVPELMNMFCECADIVTADMVNLPRPNAIYENIVIKPSDYQKKMVQDLAERAEEIRSGMVNPTKDNMLKVTTDGRALALDQRLINEALPFEENGKLSMCAKNIVNIWNESSATKGTQIVFCDLATPGKKDHFSAYDELKRILMEQDIPDNEIAFIHDANTDPKKQQLYEKVRSGEVRILIGSTAKMGAGTNVQTKLVALHHLDVPWRPRDIEQREGRIIRQGNENNEVKIFRYVTEGTFDSYSWQLIEKKQRFISQVVTNRSSARVCEDLEGAALSYAEVKALAAGNPAIKERMDLEISVTKLRTLKKQYQTEHYRLEDNVQRVFPTQIAELNETITQTESDIKLTSSSENQEFEMMFGGTSYTERKNAVAALELQLKTTKPDSYTQVGYYRNLAISVQPDVWNPGVHKVKLEGARSYCIDGCESVYGMILRIENLVERLPSLLQKAVEEKDHILKEIENARIELNKPWEQENELDAKESRLAELNAELSQTMQKSGNNQALENSTDYEMEQ